MEKIENEEKNEIQEFAKNESSNIVFGRLLEAANISGYSFERACIELEWLLENDKWKNVGQGYDDINKFLENIDFSGYKVLIEQRKKLSKKLEKLQASQRKTAGALGVNEKTIRNDLNAEKSADEEKNYIENQENINKDAEKSADKQKEVEFEDINPTEAVKNQKKKKEKEKKQEEKEQQIEEQKQQYKERAKNFKEEDIKVYNKDFRNLELEDNSIDLILTDPPYPTKYLHLWKDLFTTGKRVLKQNGFLIAYSGQLNLDAIFKYAQEAELDYYWMISIDFTTKPLIHGRNVLNQWKPILIFQNRKKKLDRTFSDKIQKNLTERELHDKNWGQTLEPFKYLVETFSNVNDLIFEPFMGSGTTLLACKNKGRRAIGCETDSELCEISKGRLI